jgi:putative transposase
MKAKQPGELVQVDHMSVGFTEGFQLKEFKATCPITGMTIMRTYSRATSRNAKAFLAYLIEQLPFGLVSVQVDGGSEFRDDFEQACKDLGLPLFVLPPKSPKLNGCVERANGTSRYEFYPFYQGALTLKAINQKLSEYQHYYNHYRPHDGIGLETPMDYYQQLIQAA